MSAIKLSSLRRLEETTKIVNFLLCAFFIALINISCIGLSYASFENNGIGARASGLNNAFTADADDVYGIYYNPSGLVQLNNPEFSSYYGKLYMGLSDNSSLGNNFFAYAHPLSFRKIKTDLRTERNLMKSNGEENHLGTVGVAYHEFKLDSIYKETSIYLSYAKILFPDFYFGLTLKSLGVSYGSDAYTQNAITLNGRAKGGMDPVFEGGKNKKALGFDIGAMYNITSDIKAGLLLANINQPDLSLKSSGNKVNFSSKLGVSGDFEFGKINFDIQRDENSNGGDNDFLAGYENWLDIGKYGELGMRAGLGIGSRSYKSASMGFSYRINMVQLDYGFTLPLAGIEDTSGAQKLSMTFRFGKEIKDEDFGTMIEREERFFQEAKETMQKALDEKKRLEFEIERLKTELRSLSNGELEQKKKQIKNLDNAIEQATEKYNQAFKTAKKFYEARILRGMTLQNRIIILEKVIEKYANVGVDVGATRLELDRMKQELINKHDEYKMAVKYYRVMVERGAGDKDKRDILMKLIRKYKEFGFDISETNNELIKLGNGSEIE